MIKPFRSLLTAALALLLLNHSLSAAPLRVLFLGDSGFHKPSARYKQLEPALTPKGIEMTYTESLDVLNPENLAQYHALVVFANHTSISPEQEKALLDYVETGHGFIPIHCASFCFLNSPKYIELVGGQFKSHGRGVFKETLVNTEHPVTKGLSPIESWDESYVHAKHNTDRVVLSERRDENGNEPYTWVRQVGKGRVFYTAWGHDERTWGNPDFVALIESGIRWAASTKCTEEPAH